MDQARVDRVIQFALLAAGQEDDAFDRELGPIHLIKYVYLADLAYAARHGGETFTDAPWRFFHYGPWAEEVHARIEPALRLIDADEKTIPSKYDHDFQRWSKVDDELFAKLQTALPIEIASSLSRHVRTFGKDTAELLHFVYATPPMVRAAPREALTFEPVEAVLQPKPAPVAPASRKAEKRAEARLVDTKQRVAAKLAKKRSDHASQSVAAAPRYDDVFDHGLAWLEGMAGSSVPTASGEVTFDDDVWKSSIRGDPRG